MACLQISSIGGGSGGAIHALTGPCRIGRAPGNDVVLDDDAQVSRHHATIVEEGDRWVLRDGGGANGTFVNGNRITRQVLCHNDLVRIGSRELRFLDPPPAARHCPRCALVAREGARFCDGCGEPLGLQPLPVIPATRLMPATSSDLTGVPKEPSQPRGARWPIVLFLTVLAVVGGGVALVWQHLRNPAGETSAPAMEPWSSRPLDLVRGGTVELEGITVIVPAGSGSGQGQVAVRRREREPGLDLGTPLTSTYEVELRRGGEGQKSRQPVHFALPVLSGLDEAALAQARIVIRTRPSSGGAWQIANAMPRFHGPSRRLIFSLPHLSLIQGDLMDSRPGARHASAEAGHNSPTGLVRVNYFVAGPRSPRGDWTPLFEHAAAPDAPPYVRDLAIYLERALAQLLAIRTRAGTNLFNRQQLPSRPLQTYVDDVGPGATGLSRIGGPLIISNQLGASAGGGAAPPERNAAMAGTAAHELVHVLQGQRYRLPSSYQVILGNRWFIEAAATYYARRAFPALIGNAWYFEMSQQYLSASLFADDDQSYYAAGHFLEWLDGRCGDGVVATAMSTPDMWDRRALVSAVNATGGPAFGDLYAEYCRGMYIGRLAPSGRFVPPSDSINLNRAGRGLQGEARIRRPAMSASAVKVVAANTAGARGLLVIEPDAAVDLRQYTYRVGCGEPEQYFERPEVGRTVLLRKDRFKALRDVGDAASRAQHRHVGLLLVNNGEREAAATFRFWLLLPPHNVRLEQGRLHWDQHAEGLTGILTGHNIYLAGKRLNEAPVSGSFSHPSIQTATSTNGLIVTVVDRLGFEWPDPPAAPPSADGSYRAEIRTSAREEKGIVETIRETQITIAGTAVSGRFSHTRSVKQEKLILESALAGRLDLATGRVQGTVRQTDVAIDRGRQKRWTGAGTFEGELVGETLTLRLDATGLGRLRTTLVARRVR